MINNFVFYGVGLKSNDLGMNPYLTFAISAVFELLAYITTHHIVDRVGRKWTYCIFLLSAGISCLSITFVCKKNYFTQFLIGIYVNYIFFYLSTTDYSGNSRNHW